MWRCGRQQGVGQGPSFTWLHGRRWRVAVALDVPALLKIAKWNQRAAGLHDRNDVTHHKIAESAMFSCTWRPKSHENIAQTAIMLDARATILKPATLDHQRRSWRDPPPAPAGNNRQNANPLPPPRSHSVRIRHRVTHRYD